MATVGGRDGLEGVHWFQLCLVQWSQALFDLLVAGLFSVM